MQGYPEVHRTHTHTHANTHTHADTHTHTHTNTLVLGLTWHFSRKQVRTTICDHPIIKDGGAGLKLEGELATHLLHNRAHVLKQACDHKVHARIFLYVARTLQQN